MHGPGGSKMNSNVMLLWAMAAVTEGAGGGLSGVETVICSLTTMSTSQLQGLGGLQVHVCVWRSMFASQGWLGLCCRRRIGGGACGQCYLKVCWKFCQNMGRCRCGGSATSCPV